MMVPELSTIISKEWKKVDKEVQLEYINKAEEINIITKGLEIPQKQIKQNSSPDLSDTESDDSMPLKKQKNN